MTGSDECSALLQILARHCDMFLHFRTDLTTLILKELFRNEKLTLYKCLKAY